jgi:aspartate 4-decarboxylase
MLSCPLNTIEIYSLSKYFGTTGWRLGLVMIAKNNRFNKLLQNLPSADKKKLQTRYDIATIDPKKLTFMQRLVFDSRQVAEAHVGGLSTPQQVLIGLFLFYDMFVQSVEYRQEIHNILLKRIKLLYAQLGTPAVIDPKGTDYYALLYVPQITENLYGSKARKYLEEHYSYLDFLFHLAKKYHVVLLPGGGFGTIDWRVRISLANLDLEDYGKIGKAFAACIKDMVKPAL